jgi:erythronate-4-phosphate dehydrogenase
MMKSDSVLINTSRGEVMETDEVEQAVHSKLSACILDVWENEPEISLSLLDSAFIGTSHIAGYSSDGKANGTSVCVKAFCEFFDLDTLKDWHPEHMPSPPMSKEIYMDGADKSKEQILFEAVMHTYPIKADSEKLKGSPHAFEKQRENYWVRREFDYYTILYKNLNPSTVESLQLLGFKTRIY